MLQSPVVTACTSGLGQSPAWSSESAGRPGTSVLSQGTGAGQGPRRGASQEVMLRTLNHQDSRPRTPQARVLSSNKLTGGGGMAGQPRVGGGSWGRPQGVGLQPRPIVFPESCSGQEEDGWGGVQSRGWRAGRTRPREGQHLRPGCEGTSRGWGGQEVRWTTWPQILHKVSGHRVEAGGGRGALSHWVEGGVAPHFPSPALQAAT